MSSSVGPQSSSSDQLGSSYIRNEFETAVPPGLAKNLAECIGGIVDEMRTHMISDDRVEEVIRGTSGQNTLVKNDFHERGDPEPFTQRNIIEPIFNLLGYPNFMTEVSGLSETQQRTADYVFSLRDHDDIDSQRLPVEAEPVNKNLHQQKHGIGQVKDWLDTYSFEAEFGIATNGIDWILLKYDRERYQYDRLAEVSLRPVFVEAFEIAANRQMSLNEWQEDIEGQVLEDFAHSFRFENVVAIASDAKSVIDKTRSEITDVFYEQYVRKVFGAVNSGEMDGEVDTRNSLIGDGIESPKAASEDDTRLFAVRSMNRLIFVKFLEDKGLTHEHLLSEFLRIYNPKDRTHSLYNEFLEPLFFKVLGKARSEREPDHENVWFYEDLPYLNSGLFRPVESDQHGFSEEDFNIKNSMMESLIQFLESYNFSADGGPKHLDPSVLGNVFERTVNHLTSEPDNSKKRLGAYYTPDEITRFCAEESVQPWLLERFKHTLINDHGRNRVDLEQYDSPLKLIDRSVPPDANVVESLLSDVDEFKALDPACGSGHFLTSVLGELVAVRKALHEKYPNQADAKPPAQRLHKDTILNNIYGVDILGPAVEIAKLRLWLSVIAEVDPDEVAEYENRDLTLPNIVFNVRQGNSLVGYTDLMETTSDGKQTRVDAWGPDSVRSKYEDVITQEHLHQNAENTETARKHLQKANDLRREYQAELNERILDDFRSAGIDSITPERIASQQPFHWVLEFARVYAEGGFDVVVGNPPWDQLKPSREDYFSRFDTSFRTRPPSTKDKIQSDLLEDEAIAKGWEEYQREIETRTEYFSHSEEYQLQKPTIDGRIDPNEKNLAALFLERIFGLASEDGYVAQVLPGVIFNGSFSKDLRLKLLNETEITSLVGFENHGIFEGIDNRYNFAVTTFRNGGRTETLRGIFQQRDVEILDNPSDHTIEIPRRVLTEYSPEARIFPFLTSPPEADALDTILAQPSLSEDIEDRWNVSIHRELDRTRDADRFVETEKEGDYPVYGGKNIHQHIHDDTLEHGAQPFSFWSVEEDVDPEKSAKHRARERTFNSGNLKKAIYTTFGGPDTSKSQKQFVNDLLDDHRGTPLSPDDVLLDCTEYRIAYRDIARASDERTMIATVLPKGAVCVNTLQTLRPYQEDPTEADLSKTPLHDAYRRMFTDEELFAATGLLNSIPFDFLIRTKTDSHIVQYKLTESQVPRLTEGDDYFEYIWRRAARLNCYGEAFAEMRDRLGGVDPATDSNEREHLRAEIDAAAFHAYSLDRDETRFVINDFHRVQNPRLMTEDYFDLVAKKYDALVD